MLTRGGEIDHLGNVGRVIANTFDVLGDEKQMRGFRNMLRIFHHISDERPKNAVVKVVDHLVATAYRRSEEHTSELQSLMRNSYAVFCLKKKNIIQPTKHYTTT